MRDFPKHGVLTQIDFHVTGRISRQLVISEYHFINDSSLLLSKIIYFHIETGVVAIEFLNFVQSRHTSNLVEVRIILWSISNDNPAFAFQGNIDVVESGSNNGAMSYQAVFVTRLRFTKITNKVRLQYDCVTRMDDLTKRIPVISTLMFRIESQ